MGLAKERLRIDQPTIAVRTHPSFGRIQPAIRLWLRLCRSIDRHAD